MHNLILTTTSTNLMDKNTLDPSQLKPKHNHHEIHDIIKIGLDPKQQNLPKEFIWSQHDLIQTDSTQELNEPLVDLSGFINGDDEKSTIKAIELVREACSSHGFFQVINHGVDQILIQKAYEEMETIFKLPVSKKRSLQRKKGCFEGYSGNHADRYSSKLPWKETYSFGYPGNDDDDQLNMMTTPVVHYFKSVFGEDFEHTGYVFEKYCAAMKKLSLVIFEVLAMSLGVEDRLHYTNFFEDGNSIIRCNHYPPCLNSGLTFGTGPHCDPTSLTILYQDQIGGLQVFAHHKWLTIRPRPDALVVNIGDTFMALSNGRYKSCLHRAIVNKEKVRRSLVYFVCPKEDKVVRPPKDLLSREVGRNYPDFTWSDFLEFTQKHYRSDVTTLNSFIQWFLSCKTI